MDDLKNETEASPELQELIRRIFSGVAAPDISFDGQLVYFKRRIFVPSSPASKTSLLQKHHSTPLAGHPGVDRTFRRLAAQFIGQR